MAMTVWSMLEQRVNQLDEPFRRSEVVGWLRWHYPHINEATLGAHIQAATANAANRARNNPLGRRAPLLERIDQGVYVRFRRSEDPALGADRAGAVRPAPAAIAGRDIAAILVGCVKSKQAGAAPAAELYVSLLFEGRRRYAVHSGVPWYILSAKYGLLASDDVVGPYDVYLAGQSADYRHAWGEFVAAQLDQLQLDGRGRAIEVHAGSAYVDPLREPLAQRGITLRAPLAGLAADDRWPGTRRTGPAPRPELAASANPGSLSPVQQAEVADAPDLISRLIDPSRSRHRGN